MPSYNKELIKYKVLIETPTMQVLRFGSYKLVVSLRTGEQFRLDSVVRDIKANGKVGYLPYFTSEDLDLVLK